MAAPDTPAAGDARDLATVLRGLREASGLTGDRLAVRVGMSQSKISKIETGRVLPSLLDVERILTALDVPPAVRPDILNLARAANMSFAAWRTVRQAGLVRRQAQVAAIEQGAALIRVFQPALVPGLLQTPEYARTVLALPRLAGTGTVGEAVAARLERQALLYDETKQLHFILTESVLRSRITSPQVMFAQLEHIATVSRLRNVNLGIVPFSAQLPEVPSNAFVLLDERVAIVESFGGEMVLRDPRDVELHAAVFDVFHAVALEGEAARQVLTELVQTWL